MPVDPGARRPVTSIELVFDAETEATIRSEWNALASAGMSSLALHTSASNRPHLTLLARHDLVDFDDRALSERRAFPVILGAPVLFGAGERRVLARSVVPTVELMDLHSIVHAAAAGGDDAPHTAAGEWSPHVTLARRVRTTDLPAALRHVGGEIHGHAASIRRWDAATATISDIHSFVAEP